MRPNEKRVLVKRTMYEIPALAYLGLEAKAFYLGN
jgi:hypothetical protein